MAAARSDWKTLPLPAARRVLSFDGSFTPGQFARIKEGFIPESMDDKWFVFFEEPWLYLHRSWTGFCIYQVRFERAGEDVRVAEVLANRDPEQYRETDDIRDALLLAVHLAGRAGRQTEAAWDRYKAYRP
jgi:8-oxo-dGTP diphosphatase